MGQTAHLTYFEVTAVPGPIGPGTARSDVYGM
jgi:hypothetical protein